MNCPKCDSPMVIVNFVQGPVSTIEHACMFCDLGAVKKQTVKPIVTDEPTFSSNVHKSAKSVTGFTTKRK